MPPRHPGYPPPAYRPPGPYPPVWRGPGGWPAPLPRPVAYYGPALPPQRRSRTGTAVAAILVLVVVVVSGLLHSATLIDAVSAGPQPSHSYSTGAHGPSNPANAPEPGQNPLLTDTAATVAPARCSYPPWSTDVDKARAFFESAAQCLADGWKPVLAKEGMSFQPPKVNVTATTAGITTPCTGSGSDFAAFYCAADQTIYLPISQLQTDYYGNNWVVYLSVFAHEFGHHVQNMAGILRKANSERVDAGARSSVGLEISRRVELQANCFDGMYLGSSKSGGSLTSSQMTKARDDADHRGDEQGDMRDHGTAQHGGEWFATGVQYDRTAHCNTFTASSGSVS